VDRDKKPGKASGATPAQDSEDATPSVGPYNPALAEIYQKLYPEMRRPKPNQEAIAAALQAMQRLTMKMDSEAAVEETTPEGSSDATLGSLAACPSCGHHNREGNKYCGMCGLSVDAATEALPTSEPSTLESPPLELPDFARELVQMPQPAPEAAHEVHPPVGAPAGAHHYHHHYHHHYL
jgi:hypothetical protein